MVTAAATSSASRGNATASGSTANMLASPANRCLVYCVGANLSRQLPAQRFRQLPRDHLSSLPARYGVKPAWCIAAAATSFRSPARPTSPTGCCGRCDRPTIDHRGPDFARARPRGAGGAAARLPDERPGRRLSRVRDRRVGGRDRQHAVARRQGADLRDRPLRDALAGDGGALRASRSTSARRLAPRRRSGAIADAARRPGRPIKAVMVVHNETSTGVTSRDPRHPRGHGRRGSPGAAAGRHDLVAGLDRLPARRMGRRRHRRRLAEGPDAAAGPELQRRLREGAGRVAGRPDAALLLGLAPMLAANRRGSFPTRRRPTCSTACAKRSDAAEEGLDDRLRPPRAPRRGHPRRRAALGPRGPGADGASTRASLTAVLCPTATTPTPAPHHPRTLRHVARRRPRQAQGQGRSGSAISATSTT